MLKALTFELSQIQLLIRREYPDSTVDFIQVPRRQSSRYSLGPTSSLRPSLAHAQSMGNGFGYRDVSGTTQRSRAPSSNTWSTSDETFDLEDKEEREPFIHDYNKLATKVVFPNTTHGVDLTTFSVVYLSSFLILLSL